MVWHILGAGSLGCLWAARLAAQQQPVYLLLRDAAALSRYQRVPGVTLSDAQRQHTQHYPVAAQLASHPQAIQRLLVACKAYDAESAVKAVAHRLTADSQVILLQNGLGSQQAVQALLPKVRCIAASSTEAAYLAAPFHSVFAGQGETWLGDLQTPTRPVPTALLNSCAAANIPCNWSTQINTKLWRKLAINCAINPLTVIHNCLNGELRHHPEKVNALCDELQLLLHSAGQASAADALHDLVWSVIDKTAANSSSMRQDVLHQRRTEISYMTGFACQQSQVLKCYTPALDALHAQLKSVLQQQGLATV
ncbi:MAG TPA: putative 2-dehydropantoate 2-reductase [Thiopseudomonas sp.]|nr:putative 2-dehydropantoate 2-reductase [Thiopseudomonas sp.]